MMHHHFVTDLDGTLLRSNAALSEFTVRTVREALDKGLVISYATARSYTSSNAIVSDIPWKYPIVLFNGAVIWDPNARKVIGGQWLEHSTANAIIVTGKEFGLVPLLFALDDADQEKVLHEKLTRTGELQFFNSRPNDPRFNELPLLSCPDSLRTLIVTYIGRLGELQPLKNAIARTYGNQIHIHLMKDNYIEDHYFLEISHAKANKKEGLRKWAELVGCKLQDITVFGDNLNDTGMFEVAGTRIAVANAHPDLLELSTAVVESNDEDGVANYIANINQQLAKQSLL